MKSVLRSIHDAFNNKKARKILVRIRIPMAIVFIIAIILNMKKEFFFYAMTLSFFGEFIQVWCFSSLDKQKTIAAKGLYAVTRNPMYLGRYFLILGGIVLTGNVILILVYTVLYYFYMVNRVKREEKTLTEIFGKAYEDYCLSVNRFLPSLKPESFKDLLFFRWKLFFQNNAHWNILSVIIVFVILYYYIF